MLEGLVSGLINPYEVGTSYFPVLPIRNYEVVDSVFLSIALRYKTGALYF